MLFVVILVGLSDKRIEDGGVHDNLPFSWRWSGWCALEDIDAPWCPHVVLALAAIPSLELLVGEKGISSFDSSSVDAEGIGEDGKEDHDGCNCNFFFYSLFCKLGMYRAETLIPLFLSKKKVELLSFSHLNRIRNSWLKWYKLSSHCVVSSKHHLNGLFTWAVWW